MQERYSDQGGTSKNSDQLIFLSDKNIFMQYDPYNQNFKTKTAQLKKKLHS